jgi:hypothetical protein
MTGILLVSKQVQNYNDGQLKWISENGISHLAYLPREAFSATRKCGRSSCICGICPRRAVSESRAFTAEHAAWRSPHLEKRKGKERNANASHR